MKFTIGKFDEASRTVPVTFSHGGVRHKRTVNASLTETGAYDAAATRETVAQVADGVAHKIDIGVIRPEPAAEAE